MTIKVYTSRHCPPCKEVDRLVRSGSFTGEDVELVDIESDEGFAEFKAEVLDIGDGAVPSAYKNGHKCEILVTDKDELVFNCPTDLPSSEPG